MCFCRPLPSDGRSDRSHRYLTLTRLLGVLGVLRVNERYVQLQVRYFISHFMTTPPVNFLTQCPLHSPHIKTHFPPLGFTFGGSSRHSRLNFHFWWIISVFPSNFFSLAYHFFAFSHHFSMSIFVLSHYYPFTAPTSNSLSLGSHCFTTSH